MEIIKIGQTSVSTTLKSLLFIHVLKLSTPSARADLPTNRSEMETKLKEASIIPQMFKMAPKYVLEVKYPGGKMVEFGNILDSAEVRQRPVSVRWPSEFTTFYTLIVTDPDSYVRRPSLYNEWQHWVVGNIPGICFLAGETLTPYMGAMIPHWLKYKPGLHRFIFTVYQQRQGKIFFTEARLPAMFDARRTNFSTKMFAKDYDLGEPLAINYFRVEPRP